MYFYLNNLQFDNCLIKTGQDPSINIFLYFKFWIHMSGRNQVGQESRCIFTFTIWIRQLPYKNRIESQYQHIFLFKVLDPYVRQGPSRAGKQMYFQLNNLQFENCLTETGQNPGINIFMYFNFWTHMSGKNQIGLECRCTFTLKIFNSTTALQKPDRIRV